MSSISEADFMDVPHRAIIAFVAQCARRLQPLLSSDFHGSDLESGSLQADRMLAELEEIAVGKTASITTSPLLEEIEVRACGREVVTYPPVVDNAMRHSYGHEGAWTAFRRILKVEDVPRCIRLAVFAAESVLDAERTSPAPDAAFDLTQHPITTSHMQRESDTYTKQAVDFALRVAEVTAEYVDPGELLTDLRILRQAQYPWKYLTGTPIPEGLVLPRSSADVFALYSSFRKEIDECPFLIEAVSHTHSVLIDYLLRHPEHLFNLTSLEFEEIVAEVFRGFGFDVHLTARTRDGGKDVVAVTYSPARLMLLIKCKRYQKERTVGVDVIRALHGVTISEGANKGILATTGKLSADAKRYLDGQNTRWLLEGRDFEGIVDWLKDYQTTKISKILCNLRNW